MSCNYADGLSPYHDKGQLGLQERFDNVSVISAKVDMLAKWINKAKHVVFHTGAGISTSAGIPDFRGPRGVWTLQAKGQKPDLSKDFNDAIPTPTHMAIARLVVSGKVKYVVSQNIDGLHLRSGLARKYLSELHGNMFIEQCNACNRQFVRNKAAPTVGQKTLNKACPTLKPNGRACRGRLHDSILDWEHSLPENDLAMADFHSCMADLSIAIGTTMQIVPSGTLPLYTKRAGGKLVIINLQPTKHDTKADLLIHGYADDVMTKLMKQLSLRIPKYSSTNDPTKLSLSSDRYFDWTITDATTAQMRKVYEAKCGDKKLLEVIDEDDIPLNTRIEKTTPSKKRKSDEGGSAKKRSRHDSSNSDSDLEVVEEVPRRTRGRPKKTATPSPAEPQPTKLTIKKNVTSSQTKYEIVKSKRPKTEVSIVHSTADDSTADLEMVCESDDDGPMVFTTNFRRYLYDDKTFKRDEKVEPAAEATPSTESSEKAENKDLSTSGPDSTENKREDDQSEIKPESEQNDEEKKDVTGTEKMDEGEKPPESSAPPKEESTEESKETTDSNDAKIAERNEESNSSVAPLVEEEKESTEKEANTDGSATSDGNEKAQPDEATSNVVDGDSQQSSAADGAAVIEPQNDGNNNRADDATQETEGEAEGDVQEQVPEGESEMAEAAAGAGDDSRESESGSAPVPEVGTGSVSMEVETEPQVQIDAEPEFDSGQPDASFSDDAFEAGGSVAHDTASASDISQAALLPPPVSDIDLLSAALPE